MFAGDAITDGDRLVDTDLVWSLSPDSAGTIESPTGRFVCAPDYLGEIVVRAADPVSGTVGRLDSGVYAELTPATEATYRDSTGMLIRIPAGAVTETRSLLLAHEELPDVRRYGRDFEVRGLDYHLKPDGLSFAPDRWTRARAARDGRRNRHRAVEQGAPQMGRLGRRRNAGRARDDDR